MSNSLNKYKVMITETLCRSVSVEAKDVDDAIDKVEARYNNSEVILDESDFIGVTFAGCLKGHNDE
jgi:hypothetical protein